MHIYTKIGSVLSKMDAVAQLFPQQYLETSKAKANVEKFIPVFAKKKKMQWELMFSFQRTIVLAHIWTEMLVIL